MNTLKTWMLLLALFLAGAGFYASAFADHDHKKDKHESKGYHDDDRQTKGSKHGLNSVNNSSYTDQCGACHFAYQPGLLPSGSWEKIMAGLNDHFGETVEPDSETRKLIGAYLKENAANYSSAKESAKIMKSLGKETPLRITDIPYIRKKHHDITSDILKRKSVGSLSNCSACHKTADRGIYKDDYVEIPR
jgi:hypothetical protein